MLMLGHYMPQAWEKEMLLEMRDTGPHLAQIEYRIFHLGGVALDAWDVGFQMSGYIEEAVVESMLADGFQMRKAPQSDLPTSWS